MIRPLALLLALAAGLLRAEPTPAPRPGLGIHDPTTPIRAEGAWWIFGTGVRVLAARSDDLVSWQKLSPALAEPSPWAADIAPGNKKHHYWAPDIVRLGDGWALYYSVSEFGKNTSAIALATSPVLDPADPRHRWTDRGVVIRSGAGDSFNAIDPSLLADSDGRLWMAFGSFWSGLFLVELDPATGLRKSPSAEPVRLTHGAEIEAPTLYRRGEYYYLFFNEGLCCKGVASTYRVRVGRARSVAGPYLDDAGRDLREEGAGRLVVGTEGDFIGPGHLSVFTRDGEDWASMHFYDGARRGAPTLALRRLSWTEDGWPVVAPAAAP